MTLPYILLIVGLMILSFHIGRNYEVISAEVEHCNRSKTLGPYEDAHTRFFGRSEFWGSNGRAVDIFSILFIPVYASAYNHSTIYRD